MIKLTTFPPNSALAYELVERLREAGVPVEVIPERIETLPTGTGVWIARAGDGQVALEVLRTLLEEESSPRCPRCGYDMHGHAGPARCPECGTPLRAEAADIRCPHCGESCPGSFELCWNCGGSMPREGADERDGSE